MTEKREVEGNTDFLTLYPQGVSADPASGANYRRGMTILCPPMPSSSREVSGDNEVKVLDGCAASKRDR